MLRWLKWHLDRFATVDAEMRLLDHAAYLPRDGLSPAFGLDEAGQMDAMGLGWVVMQPEGNRPLICRRRAAFRASSAMWRLHRRAASASLWRSTSSTSPAFQPWLKRRTS
ncbi:MAG: hypothetical protein ACLQF1_19600 [Methyloceanibacter sp.]|jgi:hypothetical protein